MRIFMAAISCVVAIGGALRCEPTVSESTAMPHRGLHIRATDHPWHNGHSAGYYQLRRECWFDLECREEIYGYFHVVDV